MKKLSFILLSISLSALLSAAQNTANVSPQKSGTTAENQSSRAQAPAASGAQGQTQTISGCLNQAGRAFTLTDSRTGTVYTLTGNIRDLSSRVGHEMQITGQPKDSDRASANAAGAPSGNSAGQHLFEVSSAKPLADQCGP